MPPFRALAPSECLRKVWQSHSSYGDERCDMIPSNCCNLHGDHHSLSMAMRSWKEYNHRSSPRKTKSCGSAKPYRQEKLRARALHNENAEWARLPNAAAGVL